MRASVRECHLSAWPTEALRGVRFRARLTGWTIRSKMHLPQMRLAKNPRDVLPVLALGCAVALMSGAVAVAGNEQLETIQPWTRVNGMLVVQGSAQYSQVRLFSDWCDPVVLTPGRRTRSCGRIPPAPRLFVGYGLFDSPAEIGRSWRASKWEMWIDGQRVNLQAFGTADRWLLKYGPAGNEDVVLREWNVTLVDATPGRHTLRYRWRDPVGVTDTTWLFTVPSA